MALPQLVLLPLRDGYSPSIGRGLLTSDSEIGYPRQRRAFVNAPQRAQMTYRVRESQLDYLLTFDNAYRGQWFLSQQQIGTDVAWHECLILDDEISLQPISYNLWDVGLSMIIKPIPRDVEVDKAIVEIYNMTGGETDTYFNMLEKLVNEDLPNATVGL